MDDFKGYINTLIDSLTLDEGEKELLEEEIRDHLYCLKKEFLDKGYSEEESIKLAIDYFGESEFIKKELSSEYSSLNKVIKALSGCFFFIYTLLLTRMLFFGTYRGHVDYSYGGNGVSYNITPFRNILMYISNFHRYNFDIWFFNTFGNVLVFIPFGFLIPILIGRLKTFSQFVKVTLLASLTIEILQWITHRGYFDVDDLILNVLGGVIGYGLLTLMTFAKRRIIEKTLLVKNS